MKAIQKSQAGFTLIELVVVIVILGILAATALPKFVDLGLDARKAVLSGIEASANAAASMVYAKAAATNVNLTTTGQTVLVNNVSVAVDYGYPTTASIEGLLQGSGGATFLTGVWTLQTNCTLTYANSTGTGVPPVLTKVVSGC